MKSPRIMFVYAAFMLVCGVGAYALAGFATKAISALIVGVASAVLMSICGLMAQQLHSNRKVGMIGIHAGIVLPLVIAGLVGWRVVGAWQGYQAGKAELFQPLIMTLMIIGSLIAFVMILRTRPAPAARS